MHLICTLKKIIENVCDLVYEMNVSQVPFVCLESLKHFNLYNHRHGKFSADNFYNCQHDKLKLTTFIIVEWLNYS